jgi:putative sigma-54 modulation protein
MDIIIESPGFKTDEKLEEFIRHKLGKVEKLDKDNNNIVRADVTLYLGPTSGTGGHYCEVRLEIPGNDLFVKRSHESFEGAVNECAEVLEQNFRKKKEKLIDSRKQDPQQLIEGEES